MGTGMRMVLSWHDMEIDNDALGRPILTVTGGVLTAFKDYRRSRYPRDPIGRGRFGPCNGDFETTNVEKEHNRVRTNKYERYT